MGKKHRKKVAMSQDERLTSTMHQCVSFVKKIWDRPLVASLILFVVLFSGLMSIYATAEGDPISDDHYFHFKYAYLLRTQGWDAVKNFDWIYLSGLAEGHGRYAVNLYQVSLIPFTYFHDWLFGLHVVDAFFASIVIAIFYFIMRKEQVRNPLFFSLLLVGSSFFFFRILLGRALVLMIAVVFLEMYFAIHKKYVPLFFVALMHVLWHQSTYFFPLIVVGVAEISRYCVDKKIAIKNFLVAGGGIVVGMMFFPGFPQSLFGWLQWIMAIVHSSSTAASGSLGGVEMTTIDLTMNSVGQAIVAIAVIFCVMAVAYMYYLYTQEDIDVYESLHTGKMQWLCALTIFTLVMAGGSFAFTGRLFDFVIPSMVLLLAFVMTALSDTNIIPSGSFSGKGITIVMWSIVLAFCAHSLLNVSDDANSFDYHPAQLAAEWIDDHSDDGDKVYLHNWSYFNLMFFANSHNVYSMGIEPLTLKAYDESLYWKYYNIFAYKYYCELPRVCKDELYDELMVKRTDADSRNAFKKENSEKIINAIKNDFGAQIILSNSKVLSGTIAMSPELIEERYDIQSEKYDGENMRFTVFKLK